MPDFYVCHKNVANFRGVLSWTDIRVFINYATRCKYLYDVV
jgi:hypothetical protein